METAGVDIVASDPVLHVGQRPRQVEAEGAPFLADGLVEPPQPAAEGAHEPGKVVPPHRSAWRPVPGSASVRRMVASPIWASATTTGTGRYGAAQIMRSDSARKVG